jgi:hypothetical protein
MSRVDRRLDPTGNPVLTAIAAFAEAFTNPLAPLLVLGIALLVGKPWLVRALAVGAACVLALVAHLDHTGGEFVLAMLGAAAALLLHAEILLHLILPGLRWLWRCLVTASELAWLMLAMLRTLWHRPRPRAPSPPKKDRTP